MNFKCFLFKPNALTDDRQIATVQKRHVAGCSNPDPTLDHGWTGGCFEQTQIVPNSY